MMLVPVALVAVACTVMVVNAIEYRDHPVASGLSPLYLDGSWGLRHTCANCSSGRAMARGMVETRHDVVINGTVPGDILTDLERAGLVTDPYFNTTWQAPGFIKAWNDGVWTYSTTFDCSASVSGASASGGGGGGGGAPENQLLVFDGIRMGAMIKVNGMLLGNATDQFLRYEFALDASQLHPTGNLLQVLPLGH